MGEALRTRAAATIGPAGEQRMASASVAVTDPEGRPTRHAARGGPGAVMGAKGLKAIVVDDAEGVRTVPGENAKEFKGEVVKFSKMVLEDPRVHNTSRYGTAGVIKFVNRENVLSMPTRNHRKGSWEEAHSISGQVIEELGKERGGKMLPCMAGCIIKCAILYNDEHGEHVTTALEFETIALLGSNLEIGPADAVAELDRLCDDIGLDTIEVGNAIGVAMEAGVLAWGDWGGNEAAAGRGRPRGHAAGTHHRGRHGARGRYLRHRPGAGGEGPGTPGLGAAHAERNGHHLLQQPPGRRPHRRHGDGAGRDAGHAREAEPPGAAHDDGGRLGGGVPVHERASGRHGGVHQRAFRRAACPRTSC